MLKLLVDSAGASALFVLVRDDTLVDFTEVAPKMGEDRVCIFLSHLQQILMRQRVSIADLAEIYAVTGPGRYTGIRLGLSMVEGLRLGTNVQVFGVRRDQIYLAAKKTHIDLFLCDSGKALAYGGRVKQNSIESFGLLHDDGACRLLQDVPDAVVLALLDADQIAQSYPRLSAQIQRWIVPSIAERAQMLSKAILKFCPTVLSQSCFLQPWYQEEAVIIARPR